MSLYLDDEEMRELRIRSCLWEKNGFPGGDEELFPVFRSMSKTKDVAIAWSCAGHKDQGRIYLLFGCTEAGFEMLQNMLEDTQDQLNTESATYPVHAYRAGLFIGRGVWPIRTETQQFYSTVTLDYNYETPAERVRALQVIIERVCSMAAEEPQESSADGWRRLALQFDGHRMNALGHLRCMIQDPAAHKAVAEAFLAAPPLSGQEVLEQRIAELAYDRKPKRKQCPYCVGRLGRVCTTCEDCMGSGEVQDTPAATEPAKLKDLQLITPMQTPEGSRTAYGDCRCACHRSPGFHHIMPCCYPEPAGNS